MNSIVHEYETEEGRRVFRVEYRVHAAFPASCHDPGEAEHVELVAIRCLAVELCLDNYDETARVRLVRRHGGVPASIVTFVPDDEQARLLGEWFERELRQWPTARADVEEQCLREARARVAVASEQTCLDYEEAGRG